MKLVIFGATGKTGIELVKQSLENGFKVTAFVRNPLKLMIENENLTITTGDVYDASGVEQAIKDQDAVVCALGVGTSLKKTTVRSIGTRNIISGMHKSNVKRLIVVSAMGVGESWNTLSFFNKFFFATLLKNSRNDHEAQEKAVKESKLDYTIIRPSGLTDAPRTDAYTYGETIKAKKAKISRADVADLIIKELRKSNLVGKAVTITEK